MKQPVVVVTGANKGLGFAMARALCRHFGPGAHIVLTARDEARGKAGVARLEAEGLSPLFARLDLVNQGSIAALADHIGAQYGGIDLLIQNGAYAAAPELPGRDQVRRMIETNNIGTHHLLRAFGPLLRSDARVLIVASGFGTLRSLDPRIHAHFDTDHMTFEDLERTLEQYVLTVERGQDVAAGWPEWINIPSKVGQVAAMRIFAREVAREGKWSPRECRLPGLDDHRFESPLPEGPPTRGHAQGARGRGGRRPLARIAPSRKHRPHGRTHPVPSHPSLEMRAMSILVVDEVECHRCGDCVSDCPARIIVLGDDGPPSVPSARLELASVGLAGATGRPFRSGLPRPMPQRLRALAATPGRSKTTTPYVTVPKTISRSASAPTSASEGAAMLSSFAARGSGLGPGVAEEPSMLMLVPAGSPRPPPSRDGSLEVEYEFTESLADFYSVPRY